MTAVAACPGCAAAPARLDATETKGGAAPAIVLSVPDLHCAGCIAAVEGALTALPGVRRARVNFGRRQVRIEGETDPATAIRAVEAAGYPAQELDAELLAGGADDPRGRMLLMCLAVAGFAMMNVMLLSVAIWSGAADATRTMFHWISAAIALPAVAFSARPFFSSAAGALAAWRLNMDVPISLAILLAAGMSLFETAFGGHQAWFDAALSLTFFLLAGRYLDHLTRRAARSAAGELTALEARRVTRLGPDGAAQVRPAELQPGDRIRLLPGECLAVDGRLVSGRARIDRSLITGESAPVSVAPGADLGAGEIVLDAAVEIEVRAVGEDTTLRRIAALIETAESARNRYTALADRAARIYAPAVHVLALVAFAGWMVTTGDARLSLNVAVAVLIITCPCALGLAVPAVSTAAAARLFREGFLLRHETALERLGEVDTVVFDKTGTLTDGMAAPDLDALDAAERRALASLAAGSSHPVARAVSLSLATGGEAADQHPVANAREVAGAGIEGDWNGVWMRLGRADWVGGQGGATAFRLGAGPVHEIARHEMLRPGAKAAVDALRGMGFGIHLVSGDRPKAAWSIADILGIKDVAADMRPEDKIAYLDALAAGGARVLMVGDGLNDTAALASAHASIAPASALDASRAAADVVLLREGLEALPQAIRTARSARARVRENFAIAAGYNLIAVPLALAGIATPLMAALAMSASSITVVLNAMRVRLP